MLDDDAVKHTSWSLGKDITNYDAERDGDWSPGEIGYGIRGDGNGDSTAIEGYFPGHYRYTTAAIMCFGRIHYDKPH